MTVDYSLNHLALFRSSRPDYIETNGALPVLIRAVLLFRSSRPDYIETSTGRMRWRSWPRIVPVFQAGLH